MLRTEFIYRHNWPEAAADHDGGDVMLGELMNQQGLLVEKFNKGVAINADDKGKESAAKRRGDSGKTPRLGSNYRRPDPK